MSLVAIIGAIALQSVPAWTYSRFDNGWEMLSISSDEKSLIFTRPGPNDNMIWSRNELAFKINNTHSIMTLFELDCTKGKYRDVQIIEYSDTNLRGTPTSTNTPTQWFYPAPNTIGERIFRRGCGLD